MLSCVDLDVEVSCCPLVLDLVPLEHGLRKAIILRFNTAQLQICLVGIIVIYLLELLEFVHLCIFIIQAYRFPPAYASKRPPREALVRGRPRVNCEIRIHRRVRLP